MTKPKSAIPKLYVEIDLRGGPRDKHKIRLPLLRNGRVRLLADRKYRTVNGIAVYILQCSKRSTFYKFTECIDATNYDQRVEDTYELLFLDAARRMLSGEAGGVVELDYDVRSPKKKRELREADRDGSLDWRIKSLVKKLKRPGETAEFTRQRIRHTQRFLEAGHDLEYAERHAPAAATAALQAQETRAHVTSK